MCGRASRNRSHTDFQQEKEENVESVADRPSPDDSCESSLPSDLVGEKYPLTALDDAIVGWDSQYDPANPRLVNE
jgi:hypothetical protein